MVEDKGRILAIDPGDSRTGVAISDPTQTLASPLKILQSQSINKTAALVLDLAQEYQVVLILIGQPLHWNGTMSEQSRGSLRLAALLQDQGSIPVELVDEYGTTQAAEKTTRQLNVSQKKRSGPLDDLAAAVLLQGYLDGRNPGDLP